VRPDDQKVKTYESKQKSNGRTGKEFPEKS